MVIVKALQETETIQINKNILKTILIHTGSRITLDFLKNMKNRNYLIEAIRKKTIELEKENWHIEYTWIKAHAGHERKELADKLAKEGTREIEICYSKFPRSETEHQEREISIKKWQQLWDNTTKGIATKEFFPQIKDRLKMKITLTSNFTAMVTAHGKTRSYLHRFKIIESPVFPCANCNQTVEHVIYDCGKLNNERRKLIVDISKEDHWPAGKTC